MKFKNLVVNGALATALCGGAAFHASAVVPDHIYNLGAITPTTPGDLQGILGLGAFYDVITFSLPNNSASTYSVLDFPIGALFKTIFSAGSLVRNPDGILFNGDDTFVSGLVNTGGNKLALNLGPIASGNYYLSVTGATAGTLGGAYSGAITVTAAPIPEPESYAMFLAGLGVMGAIVLRRKKSA